MRRYRKYTTCTVHVYQAKINSLLKLTNGRKQEVCRFYEDTPPYKIWKKSVNRYAAVSPFGTSPPRLGVSPSNRYSLNQGVIPHQSYGLNARWEISPRPLDGWWVRGQNMEGESDLGFVIDSAQLLSSNVRMPRTVTVHVAQSHTQL